MEYINPFADIDWKTEESEIIIERLKTTAADIMYSHVAAQILNDTKKLSGICIDIGGGHGKLSEYLVENSDLKCFIADINSFQLNYSKFNLEKKSYENKIFPTFSYAEELAFKNESVDLIISRGSCMFWKEPEKCVNEMLRVLKPGGIAYFGGGIGRNLTDEEYEIIKKEIYKPLQDEEEEEELKKGTPFVMLKSIYTPEFLTKWITIFEKLNISIYSVIKDSGIFFKIEKRRAAVDGEIYDGILK